MSYGFLIYRKDGALFDDSDARAIVCRALDVPLDEEQWSEPSRSSFGCQGITFLLSWPLAGSGRPGGTFIGLVTRGYTPEVMGVLCRFHRMGLHILDEETGGWLNGPAWPQGEKPVWKRGG